MGRVPSIPRLYKQDILVWTLKMKILVVWRFIDFVDLGSPGREKRTNIQRPKAVAGEEGLTKTKWTWLKRYVQFISGNDADEDFGGHHFLQWNHTILQLHSRNLKSLDLYSEFTFAACSRILAVASCSWRWHDLDAVRTSGGCFIEDPRGWPNQQVWQVDSSIKL